MMTLKTAPTEAQKQSILGRVTAVFVYLFEKVMPDPFVFAVLLTFVGALLALRFAPNATPVSVLAAWYGGVFGLFTFAFQMVIMLVPDTHWPLRPWCIAAWRSLRHLQPLLSPPSRLRSSSA